MAAEPDLKAALSQLSIELKDRLAIGSSDSHEFFLSALRVLSRIKGAGQADLRMNCIYDCGSYFYVGGFPSTAIQTAKYSIALARQSGLKEWIRKSESFLGIVYADVGSVSEALLHYAAALDVAREIKDQKGELIVLVNIGVALNYAGLYREAIPVLIRAKEAAMGSPQMRPIVTRALGNLAQSYLYTDEFSRGLREVQLSLIDEPEPSNADEALSRTVRESTYVHLAIELGLRQLAYRRAELCKKYASRGGTLRGTLVSRVTEALCMVFYGDAIAGIQELEQCLTASAEVPPVRQLTLVALVKAYDVLGNCTKALEHLQFLLQHIKTARQETVLMLLAAQRQIDELPSSEDIEKSLMPLELRESRLRAKVAEAGLVAAQLEMLDRFAISADLREEASGEHGYRVGRLSSLLAEDLGWDRDACLALDVAARLHDIGKIGIPDRILLTSEELKEAERHLMSAHTIIGAELLAKSNIPQLRLAEEIARCHHEWWNGTGYPAKLSGNRIPLHARIVALADVFDAITHGRPYEQPWPADRAIAQIRRLRGVQFDPELTDRFLLLIDRLRSEHADLDEYLSRAGRNSPFLQARQKIRQMIAMDAPTGTTVRGNETRH